MTDLGPFLRENMSKEEDAEIANRIARLLGKEKEPL